MESKQEKDIFMVNSQKASTRVTINSFMMGSLFFIFTLIWTLNPERFSIFIIAQIVLAIPLLFVSSLAYAKIGYAKDVRGWEALGWFTNNIGNIFILNAVGLMTANVNRGLAVVYFILTAVLMAIYSSINIYYRRGAMKEKLFKFAYFVFILLLGGVAPLLFQ